MSRLFSAAGRLIDLIRINAVTSEVREGKPFWIKRRRPWAAPIMAGANQFFRLSGTPVRALIDRAAWQRWEVECFQALHGESFRAFAEAQGAVAAEAVPGEDLSHHLDRGTLTPPMLRAAGHELRRAHALNCAEFSGAWSHGDPHAGNFVYDAATERARLIDFEVMHDPGLTAEERHADDLLVLLQDIAGRLPAERWLPSAHAFLAGYDCAEVIARLRGNLVVPGGFARVWWAVRTTYLPSAELRRRVETLRASL